MKQATDQGLQLGKWIGGAALGALVMYMLAPERGAPRRALSGEKLRRLGRQTGNALDKVMHAAKNDLPGDSGTTYQANDASGEQRSDQRGDQRSDQNSDLAGWRPSEGAGASHIASGRHGMHGATLASASVLGLVGLMAPRSPIGTAMGLAGLALLMRATGKRPLSLLSAGTRGQDVELKKTIRIDASPEQVFDLFADYKNFPRFMSNVLEVRDLGERRSHWVVKGPAGSHFAWNAVLTEHSRPHRLAWESEPGAQVQQWGAIEFDPIRSATRVSVRIAYRPPAGAHGHALATLLGSDPKRQLDNDLARMRSLVERGANMQASSKGGEADGRFLHCFVRVGQAQCRPGSGQRAAGSGYRVSGSEYRAVSIGLVSQAAQ